MDIESNHKRNPSAVLMLSDFANMLKAFMGSNYLTIAYAFTQSGLVPGIIGLAVIASITDHCCHLIVKCKQQAIRHVVNRHSNFNHLDSGSLQDGSSVELSPELLAMQHKMVRNMTYGDVGRIAFGGVGLFVVNMCLIFTQFGFSLGYFIFLGNTMYSLFPFTNTTIEYSDTPAANTSSLLLLSPYSLLENVTDSFYNESESSSIISSLTDVMTNNLTTVSPTVIPMMNISHFIGISEAPDLRLLVLSPLPIFIGFAFLRDVRHLGFVSVAADVSIFLGCILTMIMISVGFHISDTWHMYNWIKFPVFFGMVTSSFEGIGTIIPIESSMEGNRHNFSKFLHGAIFIMTLILLMFGVMGYLRYGDDTAQMLNKNMPDGSIGVIINICLCIGVVLTFPLQIYPVIELTEIYLFGNDRLCGPKSRSYQRLPDDDEDDEEDEQSSSEMASSTAVAMSVSDEVSTWKRNLLRIVLVCAAGGGAILLRDMYAYVGAFIGAIGSSVLAYILPCMFHLKLCWSTLPKGVRIKDFVIIVFGVVASVVSLYTTTREVIEKFG